ncbi:MAG: Rid family detoxifying hydrolase [Rhizobiaceae bacterium]|nr:Rid family detoxifying hydrolase [Rhizobiaceae bacterium]
MKKMTQLIHCNSGKVLSDELPFSEAVRVGELLFLSGQIGVTPGTLNLVKGGIGNETRQMMDNIKTVLEENGSKLANMVRCTVMLADMDEWAEFNIVYAGCFKKPYPARSAFAAKELALNARVEMECIALVD